MSIIEDLTFAQLNRHANGCAFWCTLFVVEQGAMTIDDIDQYCHDTYDPASAGRIMERGDITEGTRTAVAVGIMTVDNRDRYHATALGHRYTSWVTRKWGGYR